MKLKSTLLVSVLFLAFQLSAQENDTLSIARQFYDNKNYTKSASLLHEYLKKHPDNVYAYWLYGQIAHERKNNNLSDFLYSKAIELQPENQYLRLGYARSLFYSGQMKKSHKELQKMLQEDYEEPIISEVQLMSAYTDYWNQNYDKSNKYLNEILKKDPENVQALELKKAIKEESAPYIKLSFDYQDDNQPLHSFSEMIEVGVRKNSYFNPKLLIGNQNFSTDNQAISASVGNTFLFGDLGLSVTASAGIYKNFSDNMDWIGELKLKKKLANHLSLEGGINRVSYPYTRSSTYKTILENKAFGILEYDNPKLLSFQVLYQHKFFDNNYINTIGGWLMSKYFKVDFIEFRGGYGFGYSDSKNVEYYPEKPLEELLPDHPLGTQLPGVYDPYFTPNKQVVHLLVASFKVRVSPVISVDVSGDYGFYAKNEAPLLFSNQDELGNYKIETFYYREKFNPYKIRGTINYVFSNRLTLSAYYQYHKNNFFNENKAGAVLYYRF